MEAKINKVKKKKQHLSLSCIKGQKRKIKSEINDNLIDYFTSMSLDDEKLHDSIVLTHRFEILTITKFLGYELRFEKSDEEVWDKSTQQSCSNSQLAARKTSLVENIDCPISEHDDTIIMNEWWHSPPFNIARLNFSEFFKRTVFDYSFGMHSDIWVSKMLRSNVNISEEHTNKEGTRPILLDYNFPPNQFNTLGLRSLLLHRAIIERMGSDNFSEEENEEDTEIELHLCSQLENTLQTLFTWPIVLSVTEKGLSRGTLYKLFLHGP